MAALHIGVYHWSPRVVGYRNDYCIRCGRPRLALRHRTFDVLHIWFIPVLPLGFWKRWLCSECGSDPHANVRTRRSIRWAGTALLAFIAFVGWAASPTARPEELWFIWALRLGGIVATGAALWASIKGPPDVDLRRELQTVPPVMDPSCLLCGATLFPSEPLWRCPNCGARRHALRAG
jgi:rubredoxin